MRYPIKIFDRLITFPVVVFIYGFIGYISFFYPAAIHYLFLPCAIFSIVSLCIFIYFGASIRFFAPDESKKDKFSFFSWFIILWLGLLGFVVMGNLIQVILSNFNPYMARIYISNEAYWEAVKPLIQINDWVYWGYFSALICLAIGLSYVYYNKKGVPCAHRLAAPLIACLPHRKFSIWGKAFGEGHIYVVTMTWLALAMLCSIILLASGLLTLLHLPSYFKIPVISMSFFSILVVFFSSNFFVKTIRKINRIKVDLAMINFLFGLFVIGMLLLAGKAIELILLHNPDILKKIECDCSLGRLKLFIENRMQNLAWAIWIITLPLMTTFIVRISRGRSVLELFLAIISFAVFVQVLIYFSPKLDWFSMITLVHRTDAQLVLGGVLALFLLLLFFNKKSSWLFSNGLIKTLPRKDEEGQDIYPVSEVSLYDGTKIKGLGQVTRKWVIICLGLLVIHTIGGWQVVQVELTLFAVLFIYLYFVGLIGFLLELRQDLMSFK